MRKTKLRMGQAWGRGFQNRWARPAFYKKQLSIDHPVWAEDILPRVGAGALYKGPLRKPLGAC